VGRGSRITVKLSQGDCLVLIERGLRRTLPSRYLRLATCWDRLATSVGQLMMEPEKPVCPGRFYRSFGSLTPPSQTPKTASRSLAFRYEPISRPVRLARTVHACPSGSPKESRTNAASSKFSAVVK